MKFPLLSLLLLAGLASAAETPMEYAQGWRIETPGQQALYQLDLPYEGLAASQHDLSDIALFDAAGQPLTWWREPANIPLAREERRVALAVYPDSRITTDQTTGEILIISKPDRTEVRITPRSSAPSSEQRSPADAYIVLVPDDAPPLAELELHWHGAGGSRVAEVRIMASKTLSAWQVAGGGAIARLQGNDEAFLQRRVPLHIHNARFYRIEWDSMPADWQLEAVYGIGALETRIPTMEWRSFTPLRDGQTLTITSDALLRPEQIKPAFAGDNGVLAARIEIRNTAASS